MAEAKEVWIKYLESGGEENKDQHLAIMRDIIKRVFGSEDFKISQAVPSQSSLVEYFIDEVKQLM
jgi:hypothetical protein